MLDVPSNIQHPTSRCWMLDVGWNIQHHDVGWNIQHHDVGCWMEHVPSNIQHHDVGCSIQHLMLDVPSNIQSNPITLWLDWIGCWMEHPTSDVGWNIQHPTSWSWSWCWMLDVPSNIWCWMEHPTSWCWMLDGTCSIQHPTSWCWMFHPTSQISMELWNIKQYSFNYIGIWRKIIDYVLVVCHHSCFRLWMINKQL